jgi:hypothetical protein
MFHRGCILEACNAGRVNVGDQMGYSQYPSMQPQARTQQCPVCTKPLQPTCEELVTASKVPNKDLPLKSTGGRKRRRMTRKRRTYKGISNRRRTNKRNQTKKRRKH